MDEPRFSIDQDWLVRIRRELHAHPEIGWELENTVRVVRRELDAIGISYEVDRYGRNTIVATVNPEITSFTLGIRADMDALPIQEKNFDKPYRSRIDGAMHACGHDAHTAMLLGACRTLYGHAREAALPREAFVSALRGIPPQRRAHDVRARRDG